jgi:hypothetical protein
MPTFQLRGWYVSHDIKFADDVTTSVELPARPTREQAEGILFPPPGPSSNAGAAARTICSSPPSRSTAYRPEAPYAPGRGLRLGRNVFGVCIVLTGRREHDHRMVRDILRWCSANELLISSTQPRLTPNSVILRPLKSIEIFYLERIWPPVT